MANMGRKPTKNLNLPKGMRARRQKSGRIFYYLDTGGKPRREIPLGYDYPAAVRKWSELAIAEPPKIFTTFADLADRYRQEAIPQKAPRTQRDNLAELDKLAEFFGNPPAPLDLGPFRHHMGRPDARLRVRALKDGRAIGLDYSGLGDLDNGFRKRPEQHDNRRRRSDDGKCRHHGPVELVAQWRHQAHTTETNVRSAVGMAGAAASGIVTV